MFIILGGIDYITSASKTTAGDVRYYVLVDGAIIHGPVILEATDEPYYFDVEIPLGARQLHLLIDRFDGDHSYDHSIYGDPRLVCKARQPKP